MDASFQLARHSADMAGENEGAFEFHRGGKDGNAAAFPPQAVFLGDEAVLQGKAAERTTAQPELFAVRRWRIAVPVLFHQKGGNTPLPDLGVGLGEDKAHIGHRRQRNEFLLAVQEVAAFHLLCFGAEAEGVGAALGLGHAVGGNQFAGT